MAEVNEVIHGYRLRSLLQTGTRSQVFEVVENSSHRHMAMKILLPEKSTDKESRNELFHEAEIGTSLRHENVIHITRVNRDQVNPFFIMEFFPAGSLRNRLLAKDQKFLKEHARKIFRQLATGLAYMHVSNVVHCDVKPDNLLVNALGDLRLIDFAISKRVVTGLSKLFYRKIKAQGTPSFMAPEQILGQMLDGRADIYSLGCTVYELTTGRPPFRGNTQQDLLQRHFTQKPDTPVSHNRELTDEFGMFVLKMLAKKKEDRFQTCHEVLIALKKIKIYKDEKDIDPEAH